MWSQISSQSSFSALLLRSIGPKSLMAATTKACALMQSSSSMGRSRSAKYWSESRLNTTHPFACGGVALLRWCDRRGFACTGHSNHHRVPTLTFEEVKRLDARHGRLLIRFRVLHGFLQKRGGRRQVIDAPAFCGASLILRFSALEGVRPEPCPIVVLRSIHQVWLRRCPVTTI